MDKMRISGIGSIVGNMVKEKSFGGRMVTTAKFVNVLQVDTEFQSYIFRDKTHVGVVKRSGKLVSGILIGKDMYRKEIYIDTKKGIETIALSDIYELC